MKTQSRVQGQALVEYAVILGLVAAISIGGLYLLGRGLSQKVGSVPEAVTRTDAETVGVGETPCRNSNLPDVNLIQNGSFEEPAIRHRSWRMFREIEGWQGTHQIEIQNHVAGNPHSGVAFTELDSNRSNTISQVVRTIENCTYTLEFAFAARPGTQPTDNALAVTWNGEKVATLVKYSESQTNWQTYTYQVIATSEESTLEFADAGVSNSYGTYLDSVALYLDDSSQNILIEAK